MGALENAGQTAGRHKTSQYNRFYRVFHLSDGLSDLYSRKSLRVLGTYFTRGNKVAEEPSEKKFFWPNDLLKLL
jgi:hypothetical protein